MQDATITLGREQWQVRFVRRNHPQLGKRCWGKCYWDERTIYVRKDLSRKNIIDTLLHEMRHAQHPVTFEAAEFIDWTSTELAAGLFTTGAVE